MVRPRRSSRCPIDQSPAKACAFWLAVILSPVETASHRTIFPQKPLQLLRVQALRDVSKIYDADRAGGQKPAFTASPAPGRFQHTENRFGFRGDL
jgi:hypothetical protein